MWGNGIDGSSSGQNTAFGGAEWSLDGVLAQGTTTLRPPRATTAPMVLTTSTVDADDDEVPAEEQYRLTDEYHKLYYSQYPRDPRMLPPLRSRFGAVGKASSSGTTGGGSGGGADTASAPHHRGIDEFLPKNLFRSPQDDNLDLAAIAKRALESNLEALDLGLSPSSGQQQNLPTPAAAQQGSSLSSGRDEPGFTVAPGLTPYGKPPTSGLSESIGNRTWVSEIPSGVQGNPYAVAHQSVRVDLPSAQPQQPQQQQFSPYPSTGPPVTAGPPPRRNNSKAHQQPGASSTLAPPVDAKVRSPFVQEVLEGKRGIPPASELRGYIVEMSSDQDGSRLIQRFLDIPANVAEIAGEILPSARELMSDVFGNYVIQKVFQVATPDVHRQLASIMTGSVLEMSLQTYGCRVVQKALDHLSEEERKQMAQELHGHVPQCVLDQNANHVIQKFIDLVPGDCQFVVDAFMQNLEPLACHAYGCRVLQRIFEKCSSEPSCRVTDLLNHVLHKIDALVMNQFGNYVVQHGMINAPEELQRKFIYILTPRVFEMSCSKFASNVAEKIFELANEEEMDALVHTLTVTQKDGQGNALSTMMQDPYANYVVQRLLDKCNAQQREDVVTKIRPLLQMIRRGTYGRHLLARMEKMGMLTAGDMRLPREDGGHGGERSHQGGRGGRGGGRGQGHSSIGLSMPHVPQQQPSLQPYGVPQVQALAPQQQPFQALPQHGQQLYGSYVVSQQAQPQQSPAQHAAYTPYVNLPTPQQQVPPTAHYPYSAPGTHHSSAQQATAGQTYYTMQQVSFAPPQQHQHQHQHHHQQQLPMPQLDLGPRQGYTVNAAGPSQGPEVKPSGPYGFQGAGLQQPYGLYPVQQYPQQPYFQQQPYQQQPPQMPQNPQPQPQLPYSQPPQQYPPQQQQQQQFPQPQQQQYPPQQQYPQSAGPPLQSFTQQAGPGPYAQAPLPYTPQYTIHHPYTAQQQGQR